MRSKSILLGSLFLSLVAWVSFPASVHGGGRRGHGGHGGHGHGGHGHRGHHGHHRSHHGHHSSRHFGHHGRHHRHFGLSFGRQYYSYGSYGYPYSSFYRYPNLRYYSYGYPYSYRFSYRRYASPRYRTYDPNCVNGRRVRPVPAVRAPEQAPAAPAKQPEIEIPPVPVPEQPDNKPAIKTPSAFRAPRSGRLATFERRPAQTTRTPTAAASPGPFARSSARFGSAQLGPRLAPPAVRKLVSDETVPWVVTPVDQPPAQKPPAREVPVAQAPLLVVPISAAKPVAARR